MVQIERRVRNTVEDIAERSALDFLDQLRPGGPWVLTAIDPDSRSIETVTARDKSTARAFIRDYNGRRNLYYSVNPTRRDIDRKPKKTDTSAIEYLLADLDPNDGEASHDAKQRYLSQLERFEPAPTTIVDSGNGVQCLWQLKRPIALERPRRNDTDELEFSPEDKAIIADAEERTKALMHRLGAKAGTQNIDRILRLPGTVNLPDAKKRRDGRTSCRARLLAFNTSRHHLRDFPTAAPQQRPLIQRRRHAERAATVLPRSLEQMLHHTSAGAYNTRSGLLFAFLLAAVKQGVADAVLVDACLDPAFRGCAIYEHCHEQHAQADYVRRQIARAKQQARTTDASNENTRPLIHRSIESFPQKELQWLWHPFIPFGIFTLVVGDKAVGKSTMLLDLHARISRGWSMPKVGDEPEQQVSLGSTIILCQENDIPRIIRPRLEFARADLSRIHTLGYAVPDDPEAMDPLDRLDTKVEELEQQIRDIGDVRFIHIDPLTDYVGKIDMNRDDQVRRLLNPLGRLASRHELAIAGVLHLNKKTDLPARYRALGSVGFRNVAQSVLLVAYDKDDAPGPGQQRIIVQEEANLTPERRALTFSLVSVGQYASVSWHHMRENVDPDEYIVREKVTKEQRAAALLRDWLKDGTVAVSELRRRAEAENISWRTMEQAKQDIGALSCKLRGHGKRGNAWRLDNDPDLLREA